VRFERMSIVLAGETGAGKTLNACKLCADYLTDIVGKVGKVLICDADNLPAPRARDCIAEHFQGQESMFEVWELLREGSQNAGRTYGPDIFAGIKGAGIDYLASYENLEQKILPDFRKRISEFDAVIIDALFPQVRLNLGVAVWLNAKDNRKSPVESDYRDINPIEALVFNEFARVARLNGKPIIFTVRMTDNYEMGVKSGRRFGIRDEVAYSSSTIIEIQKTDPRQRGKVSNTYKVLCHKSPRGGAWADDITPGETELIDLLLSNQVISQPAGEIA
jgi:hypothetical protein